MDCRRVGLIGFTLVLATAALLHCATAATFVVLDGEGWSIPGNASAYPTWAANKKFKVGDVLVFNFPSEAHDVTTVTKPNYDSCGKANPFNAIRTGPARVTLATGGMHYFICTIGTHCTSGQKLAVDVAANSNTRTPPATTPPPSTSTTPPTTTTSSPPPAPPPSTSTTPPTTTTSSPPPPPPPSSASSITFSGFSAAILSMVLVFLH